MELKSKGKPKDKERHPLQFCYVRIAYLDHDGEWEQDCKVWYLDDKMVRVRPITMDDGIEVEGDNLWIPWSAICYIRELKP